MTKIVNTAPPVFDTCDLNVPTKTKARAKQEILQAIQEIEQYNSGLSQITKELSFISELAKEVSLNIEDQSSSLAAFYASLANLKDELNNFKQEIYARDIQNVEVEFAQLQKIIARNINMEAGIKLFYEHACYSANEFSKVAIH